MTETATPLQVETVPWSHGRWRFLADHLEHGTQRTQGHHLATEVDAYRRSYPGCRVYLVGHSTGCAVILAAADGLPVDGVDRVPTPGRSGNQGDQEWPCQSQQGIANRVRHVVAQGRNFAMGRFLQRGPRSLGRQT